VLINSPTKFIVSGISSDRVGAVASQIRKLKLPEFYKGKGILYENEEVVLKEIKK
jgi:large subunit ribosomal protein L6